MSDFVISDKGFPYESSSSSEIEESDIDESEELFELFHLSLGKATLIIFIRLLSYIYISILRIYHNPILFDLLI